MRRRATGPGAPGAPGAKAAAPAPGASAAALAMTVGTAVIAPLAAELAGVLAATSARRVTRVGHGRHAWIGRLAGQDVALMATGDGPAAAAGLEALLAAMRPRRLLVVGVAGGLTPGLAEGTLVAARRVVDAGGRRVPQDPDASWLHAALAGGAVAGTAVSTDQILADPAARQAVLRQALAADDLAAATVDLESAAYARVAAAWALPYLVVRAVLDPAEEVLPLDFEACRDASGRISNARVVLRALSRPRSLGQLWRLRARVRAGAARLGELARRLVAATPASGAAAEVSEVSEVTEVRGVTTVAARRTA
ncbi:MAG TPA: hypothetical protein VHG32_27870 [Thermoanaerobaculia bacterium]|nr:hypothetical protein [Thermoanaerobaculia bacterium]